MTVELQRRSWTVNHKRVYRLMREDDLLCLRRRMRYSHGLRRGLRSSARFAGWHEKPRTCCSGPRYAGSRHTERERPATVPAECRRYVCWRAGIMSDNVALFRDILPTGSDNRINPY